MTTDQDALDTAARALHGAKRATQEALACLATDQPKEAEELLREALERQQSALTLLVDALGAKRPSSNRERDQVPLGLLSTPASRDLVKALEAAFAKAAQVDTERGWIDADGEPIGFGELLGGILMGLSREVYGARGRGLE